MLTILFNPAFIFCVLNLVIGTIFITSRHKHHNREGGGGGGHQVQDPVNSPPQLLRPPSFLDRVKSFGYSSSYCSDQPGTADAHEVEVEQQEHILGQDAVNPTPQIARPPSFLERVKSFKLSSFPSGRFDPHEAEEKPAVADVRNNDDDDQEAAMRRSKSGTSSAARPAVKNILRKWASEKALAVALDSGEAETMKLREGSLTSRTEAPAAMWEDEAVDEKANDFINRFRQELKLQRLNSILSRGASQ